MRREDLEPVILDQARGEIRDQYLDATKAARRLTWTARHSLDAGLSETIAWYRQFFETGKQAAPVGH
jgi:CDP-glucose 4,6-dehydratase